MAESSGVEEDDVSGDHDDEHLLLPLRGKRKTRESNGDRGSPETSFYQAFIQVLPSATRKYVEAINTWLQGPRRPQRHRITGFQVLPSKLREKASDSQGVLVVMITLVWVAGFVLLVGWSSRVPNLKQYRRVQPIRCMQQAW
jgi:hypothetical protein